MLGSTETTFYTIAVYFGSTKIKKIRHTLFCALMADLTGFIVSAVTVCFFF
jgi:spore maturation protein B